MDDVAGNRSRYHGAAASVERVANRAEGLPGEGGEGQEGNAAAPGRRAGRVRPRVQQHREERKRRRQADENLAREFSQHSPAGGYDVERSGRGQDRVSRRESDTRIPYRGGNGGK